MNCDNNFQEENQANLKDNNFVFKIVSLDNIPEIESFLNLEAGNTNLKKSSDDFSQAIIDETSIIQTIDRENNVNYTLSYIYEDTPENVFYNLVVNVLPSGEKKAYIFKYISNPDDFRFFRDNNYNFDYFKGETEMSIYNGDLNKIHTFNRDGSDDEPCPKVYIPSPDYSGTGPLNSTVPSGSGGGSGQGGPSGLNTTIMGYNYYPGSNGVISVSWGGNTTYTGGGTSSGGGSSIGESCNCYNTHMYGFINKEPKDHQARSSTMSKSGDCEETVPPTGNPAVNQSQTQLLHIKSKLSLSKPEILWLSENTEKINSIYSFLGYNPNEEKIEFAIQYIEQSRLNPTLNLDFEASTKSPANIDRSAIDNNTPEGQKFNEIYNELANVPEFKALFIDVFNSDGTRPNVVFIIEENIISIETGLPVNGTTTQEGNNNYSIKINKQILTGPIGGMRKTKIEIAKTIAHESIHAYLFVKIQSPNLVINIPNINNLDLPQLLNSVYQNDDTQHDFFFDYMTPTLQNILYQLLDDLTSGTNRDAVENMALYQTPPSSSPVDWSWNTYAKYLSLQGLENCSGFKIQYPVGSDEKFLYDQYNINAHYNLDY